MMKATGLKRGSRKKTQQQSQTTQQQAVVDKEDPDQRPVSEMNQQQTVTSHQTQPQLQHEDCTLPMQRRKQNDEVAVLTTKNYRLAKELADLRVRYRDECKNSTRLTIENMNLASRCREAISHVAMLKKELAMQQQRTAAALASQREQTQRMADSLSSSMEMSRISRESAEEAVDSKDDNLARLITSSPSPQRPSVRDSASPSSSKSSASARPASPPEETRDSPPSDLVASPADSRGALEADDVEDATTIGPVSTISTSPIESVEEVENPNATTTNESGSRVYSTPTRLVRWSPDFQGPINKETTQIGAGLFPQSASPQVFSPTRPNSYNEELPSDVHTGDEDDSGAFPSSNTQHRIVNLSNSIDAFEKSFSVDFPDSFTSKESQLNSSGKDHKLDIYNPFCSSPERSLSRGKKISGSFINRDQEEMKTNENSVRDLKSLNFDSPPRTPITRSKPDFGEPPRPGKSGASAARERYEKALHPRKGNQNKRLSLSVETRNGSSSNAIVNIVDAFEEKIDTVSSKRRLSLRRNVKHPISYAEPPLNIKLRQGDTYFPKAGESQPTAIVTPTSVASS